MIRTATLSGFVISSDLLHQVNNGSPELSVLDAHVGFREREPLRRGEEFREIVGRLVQYIGQSGYTFEKEGDWDAETSHLAPLRASPGSFPASYVAFVLDCPRAGRFHVVIFWLSTHSRATSYQRHRWLQGPSCDACSCLSCNFARQ